MLLLTKLKGGNHLQNYTKSFDYTSFVIIDA